MGERSVPSGQLQKNCGHYTHLGTFQPLANVVVCVKGACAKSSKFSTNKPCSTGSSNTIYMSHHTYSTCQRELRHHELCITYKFSGLLSVGTANVDAMIHPRWLFSPLLFSFCLDTWIFPDVSNSTAQKEKTFPVARQIAKCFALLETNLGMDSVVGRRQ